MKDVLLIYGNEGQMPMDPNSPETQKVFAAYGAYTEDIQKRGLMKAGEGLQPTATATTVRVRNGQRSISDGPFAETKEQLGGFYLVDCKDLDEAIDCAARIPGAATGSIEVRPVIPM